MSPKVELRDGVPLRVAVKTVRSLCQKAFVSERRRGATAALLDAREQSHPLMLVLAIRDSVEIGHEVVHRLGVRGCGPQFLSVR